jgi:ATP-dependent helicase HepA
VTYEADARLPRLWSHLDEWRTQVAAETAGLPLSRRQAATDTYFALAWALSTNREHLRQLVQERLGDRKTSAAEYDPLRNILDLLQDGPLSPLPAFGTLMKELRRAGPREKHVLFVDSASHCRDFAEMILRDRLSDAVVAHRLMSPPQIAASVQSFSDDPAKHFLISDASLEEGRNLQMADGVAFLDLPLDPMRLEQRIGRLDRIPRTTDVNCYFLLTCDDAELALDTAWHRLLLHGFGLVSDSAASLAALRDEDAVFNQSLADVQLLVQEEMVRLRALAFQHGPGALNREADNVRKHVREEREALDEQDAVDGLYFGDLTATPLWRSIAAAESPHSVNNFRDQLGRYWQDFLGLRVQPGASNQQIATYTYAPNRTPLLPVARLQRLSGVVNQATTTHRLLAVARPSLGFLRPGHGFIDELRVLADWDDRGRVFAMWRRLSRQTEPLLVFRVRLISALELPKLGRHLEATTFDTLGRCALHRLVNSWFSPRLDEIFLDESGKPVDEDLAVLCQRPYRDGVDIGLTGPRAEILADIAGRSAWPDLCGRIAEAADLCIRHSQSFRQDQERAIESASEHFRISVARLNVRRGRGAESEAARRRAVTQEDNLRDLVVGLISAPSVRIDSVGVYVLSDRPVSPKETKA